MRRRRVMILAPWPLRVPRHGGQIRGSAVVQAYRDAGHFVYPVGYYDPGRVSDADIWPTDVPITPGVGRLMSSEPETPGSPLRFWRAVAAAEDSVSLFAHAVQEARPEILQFEEPYLWPVVRRLVSAGLLDGVALIHSSYNFETGALLELTAAGALISASHLVEFAQLEHEISRSCDLVVAVSTQDAMRFRALGARDVCVAINGTRAPRQAAGIGKIKRYIDEDERFALFVSSAHLPNSHGIVSLAAAASRAHLTHGELLICGEVGSLIRAHPRFRAAQRVLHRARFLGWVEDDLLSALIAQSRVVVLPKTLGGGSNLKTAEALASGRPIVATRKALVGFEEFSHAPGITLEDDPDGFWSAVDAYLSGPMLVPERSPETVRALLWSECLKPMVRSAERL